MNHQLMNKPQPSLAAVWTLNGHQALRLRVGPGARELLVTQGRLWLTQQGTCHQPAQDIWLQAGQLLVLKSGSRWVIEGWGHTEFQLLVPPQACWGGMRDLRRLVLRPMRGRSMGLPALG